MDLDDPASLKQDNCSCWVCLVVVALIDLDKPTERELAIGELVDAVMNTLFEPSPPTGGEPLIAG